MKTIGEQIAHYRRLRGYSQSKLAELCGLHDKGVISKYERNMRTPDLNTTLPEICKVLNIKFDIVFTEK